METLKALIIEDNAFMATILNDMLRQNHSIIVSGIASSGKEALKLINNTKPDMVFLDVELPDMTGFEVLGQLRTIDFKTIFTTAHSHYAIKAFRFNALDYLVKPIDETHLREAIDRFKSITKTDSKNQIETTLKNLNTHSVAEQRLVLHTQNGYLKLPLKHIVVIESARNYSYIHLSGGKQELISKTLSYFEDILEDKAFFRCHRSFLVNKFHIADLKDDIFILKNGTDIPISRRKKSEAINWFMD